MASQHHDRSRRATALPLFRDQSVQARREPLHGPVTVVLPPAAWFASLLSLVCVVFLGLATWLVEVPQSASAVGVLMPAGGYVRIVATDGGRVTELLAREGQRVEQGQAVVAVTADSSNAGRDFVSRARLRSLEAELALREALQRQEGHARARRRDAIESQIAQSEEEMQVAETQIGLLDGRAALLAARLDRIRVLAKEGNVSGTQLEDVRLALLEARAAAESLRRQTVRIGQERDRFLAERGALEDEAALRAIEQSIAREQLRRDLPDVEAHIGLELRAPRDGVIAHIMVRPGQPVRPGQTLATLYRSAADLEAWLYVPSRHAGSLRAGQSVELSFDAWPREMFGTRSAVITAVSAIALLPSELDVPIALSGPVFEVRARLDARAIRANGEDWPLAAGTAVSAEVVQQRYRLYEWLLRLERHEETPRSPADA